MLESWLTQKEQLLLSIQSSGTTDHNEVVANLRKLAVSDCVHYTSVQSIFSMFLYSFTTDSFSKSNMKPGCMYIYAVPPTIVVVPQVFTP